MAIQHNVPEEQESRHPILPEEAVACADIVLKFLHVAAIKATGDAAVARLADDIDDVITDINTTEAQHVEVVGSLTCILQALDRDPDISDNKIRALQNGLKHLALNYKMETLGGVR